MAELEEFEFKEMPVFDEEWKYESVRNDWKIYVLSLVVFYVDSLIRCKDKENGLEYE